MNSNSNRRATVEAIRTEFESSRGSRIWTDFVNALRLVSQVVFTRSSGFVLEFIQNAEDAGQGVAGKEDWSGPELAQRVAALNATLELESGTPAPKPVVDLLKPMRGIVGRHRVAAVADTFGISGA